MSPASAKHSQASRPVCTVRQILDRIGDKWSLYIICSLKGAPMRFNELKRSIEGISQRMLTLTLMGLTRDGLVKRTVFQTKPLRVEYELTPLGETLLIPVMDLVRWADINRTNIEQARERFERSNALTYSPREARRKQGAAA